MSFIQRLRESGWWSHYTCKTCFNKVVMGRDCSCIERGRAVSKANILEIAKELLALEKKATPGEWKLFRDPAKSGQMLVTGKRRPELNFEVRSPSFDEVPIIVAKISHQFEDAVLIQESRNNLRVLCEALVEAHAVLDLAAAQDIITPKVRPLSQYARAWLKKWGGE